MIFLCPHCGATKDRSVLFAREPGEGDDLAIMFCNTCLGLIVWSPNEPRPVPRKPTAAEAEFIAKSGVALKSFDHAVTRWLERGG